MNGVVTLQSISNMGSKAQPDPIPNGYGTVTFPHCFGHPGFVMLAALVIVLVGEGAGAVAFVGGEVEFVGGDVVLEGIIWAVASVKISIKQGSWKENRAT